MEKVRLSMDALHVQPWGCAGGPGNTCDGNCDCRSGGCDPILRITRRS